MSPMLRSEFRLLMRDPTLWVTLVVLLACLSFAANSGARYRAQWLATADSQAQNSRALRHQQLAELRGERAADPRAANPAGTPGSVKVAVPAAVPPLAHFSVGQSDLYPRSADVGLLTRVDAIFKQYQMQSPLTLASGRFDLAYVVVAILPLLAIVLCFDVVAADRIGGRLPLLAVQAGGLAALVARRLWLRGAVLMLPLLLMLAGGLAGGAPLVPLLCWLGIAALYAGFWLLLCAWVALGRTRPETQTAQLVSLWVLLVLAMPAAINRLVEQVAAPPSQQAFQATLREAEVRAGRRAEQLLAGYLSDHPELARAGSEDYASWMKKSVVVRQTVEAETLAVMQAHEQQLARSRRAAQRLQFLSPAAVAQVALSDAAGTGPEQQVAYVAAVRAYKHALQERLVPSLYRATRLTAEELAALLDFEAPRWVPAHGGGLLGASALMLAALCLLLRWRIRAAARQLVSLVT